MTGAADRSAFVVAVRGKHSLVKPPLSERLVSGSVTLASGEAVGSHWTNGREEVLVILSGRATLICNGKRFTVSERQLAYIPPDTEHDVVNESDRPLAYVYIVTPLDDGRRVHEQTR